MARRSGFGTLALMAGLLTTVPFVRAGQTADAGIPDAHIIACAATGAIRTDRLSSRQLRTWKRIEGIVFARDAAGRLSHPTLEGFWRQVGTSGHKVFIDMFATALESTAANVTIERLDPEGKNHTLSIRLYLAAIDNADTSNWARRADGFTPFKHLNREERYAQVIGHELAHVVWIIQDPYYAALVREQNELRTELLARTRKERKVVYDSENLLRLRRLAILTGHLEAPANAIEIEIWRELVGNCEKSREGRTIGDLAIFQSAR
jgi:hypothetical protein